MHSRTPARQSATKSATASTPQQRAAEAMLRRLTNLPSAAGREGRVIAFVEQWVKRRRSLVLQRDRYGNLMIQRRAAPSGKSARPVVIEAHMDHPAFVVTEVIDTHHLAADFRGGVDPDYFVGTRVALHHGTGAPARGVVRTIEPRQDQWADHRVTVEFPRRVAAAVGDVLTWAIAPARVTNGRLHTLACDNLAGVAAALTALDLLLKKRLRPQPDIRVLLTRAEEVGFVGAIGAARSGIISKGASVIVLECSKALPDARIGDGPIVRVGDKTHAFSPEITYALSQVATALAGRDKTFLWQRKLMTGGTCNASAYHSLGYRAGCLCLPLGNYHNMVPCSSRKPKGRIAAETISLVDWHGLVRLLIEAGLTLGRGADAPDFADVLGRIFAARGDLLS